jgi:hypothetical protein
MLSITVVYGPSFKGSVDELKLVSRRLVVAALNTVVRPSSKINPRLVTVSSQRANARQLSTRQVMIIVSASVESKDERLTEDNRLALRGLIEGAIARVYPDFALFNVLLSFDMQIERFNARPLVIGTINENDLAIIDQEVSSMQGIRAKALAHASSH